MKTADAEAAARPSAGLSAPTAFADDASAWWRGAVMYHIYPRSFRDSNGDGVGDLIGAAEGLDYIASLGVDGVWLSPFFTSPMRDFGYDVADYCDVDPIFGRIEDFDHFLEKAHRLGLKVIIDQVYSHTSDEHAWFAESRSGESNAKADWYVWADPKADGTPPNNWQSVFGGGAWTWDSRRQQYYLHNFLSSQPDLNLHNPDVQNALLDAGRFWLDRRVDGFRLDAINFSMHDPLLRDNPPAQMNGRAPTRPFDYQSHIHNQSHPDIPKFLERIRSLADEYPSVFTVAEVGGPEPLAEMRMFTADDKHLNSAYNFAFLYADKISAALTRSAVGAWSGAPGEGWPSWAFSNHDAPRAVSRWASQEDAARASKLYAMLLLCLRGSIFLYQGEELGLPQAELSFEALKDPEAIANWPATLGRDGARTPMPWEAAAPHAGFSTAPPWLPVDPRHATLSVDAQERDPKSVLHFVRKMIAARNASPALRSGTMTFIEDPSLLAFYRASEEDEVLCVFNLDTVERSWRAPDKGRFRRVLDIGMAHGAEGLPDKLPPLSGLVAIRGN